MGNYDLPNTAALLIALGSKNVSGMKAYAAPLGLSLITTAQFEKNLAEFVKQDGLFNTARSVHQDASDAYQATLDPVYEWILGVSNTLATRFGTRWNTQWAQAGFINNTTAIPTKIEDRLSLTLSLSNFFAANPSFEVPSLDQTAAYGAGLRDEALKKQELLTAAEIAKDGAKTAFDTAWTTLVAGMHSLLRNLSDVLKNDDPRWLAFGFNMPATPTTPGKPTNVQAQMDENGAIMVTCDAEPLATRYRFRRLIVGVEISYLLADSSKEPVGWIKDVMPGQTVQIVVQAVNGNLQGVASDPLQFTLPPLTKRSEANETPNGAAHREVSAPSGNGHANGNRQTTLS